jgi:hypothetical protein
VGHASLTFVLVPMLLTTHVQQTCHLGLINVNDQLLVECFFDHSRIPAAGCESVIPHVQGVRLNHTIFAREERPARL